MKDPYFFSFDNFKLMRSLIGHSSLALANSMLRDQLQELANKDHLTKLYARRYLDNIVGKSISTNEGGVFILLDIDDFKNVNDTFGHETGDAVLKQIGSYIVNKFKGIGVAAGGAGKNLPSIYHLMIKQTGRKLAERLIEQIPSITTPSVTVSAGLNSWVAAGQP